MIFFLPPSSPDFMLPLWYLSHPTLSWHLAQLWSCLPLLLSGRPMGSLIDKTTPQHCHCLRHSHPILQPHSSLGLVPFPFIHPSTGLGTAIHISTSGPFLAKVLHASCYSILCTTHLI